MALEWGNRMESDDLVQRKKTGFEIGSDVSSYSVEELEALVRNLNEEVSRINTAIERKKSELESAHSIFKN